MNIPPMEEKLEHKMDIPKTLKEVVSNTSELIDENTIEITRVEKWEVLKSNLLAIKESLEDYTILKQTAFDEINEYLTIFDEEIIGGEEVTEIPIQSSGRYYRSGDQSIPSGVKTKVEVDLKEFDMLNNWDTANKRLVIPVNGRYLLIGKVYIQALGANKFLTCYLYRNGLIDTGGNKIYASTAGDVTVYVIIDMPLWAGDYIELYCYHNHGSNRNVVLNCALNWQKMF